MFTAYLFHAASMVKIKFTYLTVILIGYILVRSWRTANRLDRTFWTVVTYWTEISYDWMNGTIWTLVTVEHGWMVVDGARVTVVSGSTETRWRC